MIGVHYFHRQCSCGDGHTASFRISSFLTGMLVPGMLATGMLARLTWPQSLGLLTPWS